jgi:prolipoprotein diacylglyceryl transferase
MLAYLYWDPKPEVFFLPVVDWPILWYGALFALGFAIGFPIFVGILTRFFFQRPEFEERELKGEFGEPRLALASKKGRAALAAALNDWMVSEEEAIDFHLLPKEAHLATCSLHPQKALRRLKLEHLFEKGILSLKKQAIQLTDRLTVYMVIATVLGARIGHLLFYEKPASYLNNPIEVIQIWEGGLASHGAAVGIVLGLWLFSYRHRVRGLTLLHLLDFVAVPTALAGTFIRVGNFFNQEVLGTPTDLPWAVLFGHPADHSLPIPRHPAQLYEALFYLAVFFILWRLSFRPKYLLEEGKLIGLFLILVFGFRFFVEFYKVEQSRLIPTFLDLTMGQILSIPAVIAGIWLFFIRVRHKCS